MRRLVMLGVAGILVLACQFPLSASYGPLNEPSAPVRAYLLYHLVGPSYGDRNVWHPDAPSAAQLGLDLAMNMASMEFLLEMPTDQDRQRIEGLLRRQGAAEVDVRAEHPERAVVRFRTPGQDDALVFAVLLDNDEWKLFSLADEEDPWSTFAPLDQAARAETEVEAGGWIRITDYWAYRGVTMRQRSSDVVVMGELMRTKAPSGLIPSTLRIVFRDHSGTVVELSGSIMMTSMDVGETRAFKETVYDLRLEDVGSWEFQVE